MNSTVRVLHVIDSFGHGGAEQNLLTMLQELRVGFEHHLVSLYPDDRLRAQFERYAASVVCLGVSGPAQHLNAVRAIARLIRDKQIDVVSSQLIRAQIIARLAAAVRQTPIVITWQNTSYNFLSEFGNSPSRRALTLAADWITGFRDHSIIAVSKTVRDANCKQLGIAPERVRVIPNAVSLDRVHPITEEQRLRVRASFGLAATDVMLLSIGRLVEQKAHLDAIAAMTGVLERVPRAKYFIAGQGPMRDQLQSRIVELDLDAHVSMLGPRSDVGELLQAADLFVFPSRFEGLPVALIEAISAGTRCVASDIPQNREAAQECREVQFSPTGNPTALARAIIAALAARTDTSLDRDATRRCFGAPTVAIDFGSVLKEAAGQ